MSEGSTNAVEDFVDSLKKEESADVISELYKEERGNVS